MTTPHDGSSRVSTWIKGSIVGLLVLVPVVAFFASDDLRFTAGGAIIDFGYLVQDPIPAHESLSPGEIWAQLQAHNDLAADVREQFPRTNHHPLVALVVCMDARLDTNELVGDTRRYYYVLRTAGSVLSEREEEMLELAVAGGVKVIVLTTHTDCAAERAAADPVLRERYPHLSAGVDERRARRVELLARPAIASRIRSGELLVHHARIETASGRLMIDTASELRTASAHPTPTRRAHE